MQALSGRGFVLACSALMAVSETAKRDIDRLAWVALALWLALVVGGIGAVTSGVRSLQSHARMTGHAQGVIIGLEDAPDYNHTNYFYPRVRFVADGREVQFVGAVGRPEGEYRAGQTVDVRYAPDEPTVADVANADDGSEGTTPVVIGSIMLLIALAFAVRALRRRWAARGG